MAVRALSIQEFEKFGAARVTVDGLTLRAVEWFADDGGVVLGVIAYHPADLAWALVILGRDIYGKFRALDRDRGLRDLDEARRTLVEKMVLASGRKALTAPSAA